MDPGSVRGCSHLEVGQLQPGRVPARDEFEQQNDVCDLVLDVRVGTASRIQRHPQCIMVERVGNSGDSASGYSGDVNLGRRCIP